MLYTEVPLEPGWLKEELDAAGRNADSLPEALRFEVLLQRLSQGDGESERLDGKGNGRPAGSDSARHPFRPPRNRSREDSQL